METEFKPGDRVILRNTGDEGVAAEERGMVVCTWSCDTNGQDCYVAFFGSEWPEVDQKPEKPYVLRYYASSLELAGEDGPV